MSQWITFIRRHRIAIAAVGVVLILGAAAGARAWLRDPILAEYPDSPFPRIPDDSPRIIPLDEAPLAADKAAYDAYWDQRREVNTYQQQSGAMQDATQDEREAYRLAVFDEEYVQARELVVKILQENSRSVPGRFALAMIEHYGEGNFPRALYLLRTIRHEMHKRGVKNPNDEIAREWYVRVIYRELWVLENMSRNKEVLRVIDLIEAVYAPFEWKRVWSLIRLQRYDEARQALEQGEKRGTYKYYLMNGRMTLEDELGRRDEAYAAGKLYVEAHQDSQLAWSNFAGECAFSFRFEEAEEARWKSARATSGTFYGSPYTYLASTLAEKGQFAEAWDALKKAQVQRRQRDAFTLVMDQSTFDRNSAFVLFLLGHSEDALRLGRRAVERPTRDNTSSSVRDRDLSGRLFLFFMIRNRLHELKEIRAAGGEMAADASEESGRLDRESWTLRRQIAALLVDDEYLIRILRPLLPGSPAPNTIFTSDLVGLLPAGVGREAVRRARHDEPHASAPPYFDALEADMAWLDGQFQDAVSFAKTAIAGLSPQYERCLRARVAAVAADSLRRLGRLDEALPLYDQALAECPAVFRLLDVPLPIAIAQDDQPLSQQWFKLLLESPRFVGEPNGFVVMLRSAPGTLTFEFFRPGNVRHCQDTITADDDQEELLAFATRRLIHRILSPQLDLSTTDINSLENGIFAAPSTSETDRLLRLAAPKN